MRASEQAEQMLLRVKSIEQQNEDLKTELATLRAQLAGKLVLSEPLSSQAFDALDESTPLIVERFDGTLWQTVKSRFDWDEEDDYFRCLFVDHRPWPTLPHPEVPAEHLPSAPKFLGVVEHKITGAVWFVTMICEDCLRAVTSEGNITKNIFFDGKWKAIDHPEVPNTPELLDALNESEATE